MLAERKKKQRWCLNPRGKEWSEDTNKFGQKLLERMGWSKGKGLGLNENGITEHVQVTYKNDTKGMGFREDENPWTENEIQYSNFLKTLQSKEGYNSQLGSDGASDNSESNEHIKVESLEKKSEQSRTRVHYKKFTRGKDLSRYSTKDLACIFGKSALQPSKSPKPSDEISDDVVTSTTSNTTDSTLGNNLIAAGCMDEYFKNKMRTLKSKFDDVATPSSDPQNDSQPQTSNIGDNGNCQETVESQCDSTVSKKKKKKSKKEQSPTDFIGETENETTEHRKSKKKSKKHTKNKIIESGIDNPALNLNSPNGEIETGTFDDPSEPNSSKNVHIEQEGIDNPALSLADSPESIPVTSIFEVKRKKKRKNEITTQENEIQEKPSKKRKKEKHIESTSTGVTPDTVDDNQDFNPEIKIKKRKRKNSENDTNTPSVGKKKKKSKSHGIDNLALQLSSEDTSPTSSTDIKKSKKKHKKDKHKTKLQNTNTSLTDTDISSNGIFLETENAQLGYENPAYNSNTSNNSLSNNLSVQSTPKSVLKKKDLTNQTSASTPARKSVQINESMNQEKFITDSENSFSSTNTDEDSISKRIDNYQNELENALNEQKHQNKKHIKTATSSTTAPSTVQNSPKDYTAQKFKYIALHHLAKGESTIAFPGVSIQRMISGYGSPKN